MKAIGLRKTKTPRQGIEPWFSDLESDVLTIERPRIVASPFHFQFKLWLVFAFRNC